MSIRFQNVAGGRTGGDRTRIQLCGRLSVEVDRVQLAGALRGRQVPLLLAYLALHRDRHVGRDELIGALWPSHPPRSQEAALRTLLSRLRSALGADALDGRDELHLELPEPVWIDVEAAGTEMERARRSLEAGDARTAWALAQVPLNIAGRGLLPGASADWIELRRRELEDLRLEALEVVGRAGLMLGGTQLASVERASRALIETEPYRESGYVLLMEALGAQGNVAEGLRVFERLRSMLRDELGTLPSPDTIAAHERLLHPRLAGSGAAGGNSDPLHPEVVLELPPELRARADAPLVGRARELEALQNLWDRAPGTDREDTEPARLVLLAGDAGIGKTRLVAALARSAHEGGGVVLAGRSPEQNVVPYQPFLEALRHYILNVPIADLRASAREYGSELARLVPEIRRRAPELAPPATGEPETERYRLFEAVVGLLQEIANSAPVLLVLDDLQWADRPTLLLLRHLARAPAAHRVLILGAYRSTETDGGEGFGEALTDLRRGRVLHQLDIGGLSARETAELVGIHTGANPSSGFSRALQEETEGNPFFIEEIVRHLTEAGISVARADADTLRRAGLPDGVKEVIARRLARLGETEIEWLRVASVIGRDFDADLLESVAGLEEEAFLRALEAALAAGLVGESPGRPGLYSFTHALIRETLYEGMSLPRRARLHRRVGEALERQDPERHLNLLALHFTRAAGPQDAEKAIRYAVRAGERASTMLAHEEAADHLRRALEVARRLAPENETQCLELLLALGEAQVRAGERERAAESLREAAELAECLQDDPALARAAIGASRRYVQQPGVVDDQLIDLLRRALARNGPERAGIRVALLARLCGALYFSPEREQMLELSQEAMALAAKLDDDEARANACAARRRALWDAAHLSERLETSTEMLTRARGAGDLELQLQAHAWLVVDLLEHGDRDAVDAQIEAFTAGAENLRQPMYVWNAIVWRAMRALLAGELEQAERLASDALAAGGRAEAVTAPQYFAIQLLAIRQEQGRMGELEQAARELVAGNPARPAWRAALAALLVQSGRAREGAAELEVLAANRFEDFPADGDWMVTVTLLSDVCSALGDAERSAMLYKLLLPYRQANVVIGLAAVCLGSAERYLGKLAAAMGRHSDAVGHLERALQANARLKAPVWTAHTQLDLAALLSDENRAGLLAHEAAATASELDLPALRARAAQLVAA